MRFSVFASVAVALVLAVAGTALAAIGITYPKGPDPAVKTWPSWPYPTACEGLSFDPIAVFSGPTGAERGPGAPEVALQKYVENGPYRYLPKRFWRLVSSTDTRVVFSSGRLAFGLTLLDFRLADGVWTAAGSPGHCRPRTTREGAEAVQWRLDGVQRPEDARRVRLEALGVGGCGSEETLLSRLHPEFKQVESNLVLTIWKEDSASGAECKKKHGPLPMSVKLPGRLGDRELWDGSSYPPRRVR